MDFYVYIYLDTTKPNKVNSPYFCVNFTPFYIGKGTGDRYKLETKIGEDECNQFLRRKILKIRNTREPEILIIPCDSEESAFSLEFLLTEYFGIFPNGVLCNLRPGGKGGFKLTDETKRKLSLANQGENNPNYGRRWTESQREKWHASFSAKDRSRSAESMKKTWDGKNRKYLIKDLNGNEIIVDDLTKYCSEYSFPLTAFRFALKNGNVVKSKRRKSRIEGYQIFYIDGKS